MDAHARKDDAQEAGDAMTPGRRPGLPPDQEDPGREARWAKWRADNADAIAAYNSWFEQEGHRYLRDPLF